MIQYLKVHKGNIVNIFKIISYFLLALVFSGCMMRAIPGSAISPDIYIDKKFVKSEEIAFNEQILGVYSPNNGLIIVSKENSLTFINPDTQKKIKELDKSYILEVDLPYPVFSRYDEKSHKTNLECINSNGTELWKKSLDGKLLSTHTKHKSLIIAVEKNGLITLTSLNRKDAKVEWTTKKKTTHSHVSFLNAKDKLYIIIDRRLYELSSNGKFIHKYDFTPGIDVKKLVINDNSIIIYGYIDTKSKAIVKVVSLTSNNIEFKKTIDIKENFYDDILVDKNILYIINDKKLSSFNMLNWKNIQNVELDIEDDGYETLNDIIVYKDKILLIGLSEIYAYSKKDFTLLWKHEELWTPYRLHIAERKRAAALMGATSAMYTHGVGDYGRTIIGDQFSSTSKYAIYANEYLEKINVNKSPSKSTLNIAFARGYSSYSLTYYKYDAVVDLINLDTGKSKNIQLADKNGRCYPNVYVDMKNKVIYESYGVLFYSCPTSKQIDIIKY